MANQSVVFITGNDRKLAEVQDGLGDRVSLCRQSFELQEIQGSITEIALEKCRIASIRFNGPVLTEDTSLCFDALHGMPGPYIKHFHDAIGNNGLNNMLLAYNDKGAKAICTFAFCEGPGYEPKLFQGIVEGTIVSPRGPSNFGWDPIFEIDGETFAQMDTIKKNSLSHRGLALSKLREYLESRL